MPLFRHPPCLWASRTHLFRRPGLILLRWRSDVRSKENLAKSRAKSRTKSRTRDTHDHTQQDSVLTSTESHATVLNLIDRVFPFILNQNFATKEQLSLWGIRNQTELNKLEDKFQQEIYEQARQDCNLPLPPLFTKLHKAFIAGGQQDLRVALQAAFSTFILSAKFSPKNLQTQARITDLTYPSEWFPATRAIQRKVILHVGPTNSGKTYRALKRLEEAKTGIFAGPLRLLAHEVYTRLNAKNVPCALVTGEERREPPGFDVSGEVPMRSCTVEMVPLNTKVEVAVIDEIQMLGDADRGWAWTQAFLGVQAEELHLCGEERTVPLIRELCALVGDELEVHHYKRLSPLKAMDRNIDPNLKALRKGDCVISFSRLSIHQMKLDIERATGRRCAVVYGSLPPETRAQQAALFNDPDNEYDFLAASDAIGMGLNLSIKRIVFRTLLKFNGKEEKLLTIPQIKQIAGRAGRYRTAAQATETRVSNVLDLDFIVPKQEPKSVGLVTSFLKDDIRRIKSAISTEPPPITSAGIYPSDGIIDRFAAQFPPNTPFSYILLHLHEVATLHPRFHLCDLRDQTVIADIIQPFKLTLRERLTFIAAPIQTRTPEVVNIVQSLARCVAEQSGGDLVDIAAIDLELLDEPENLTDKMYLGRLESLHSALGTYLWLSYRFAGIFRSVNLGFHVKALVEDKINRSLAAVTGRKSSLKKKLEQRHRSLNSQHKADMSDRGVEERETDSNELLEGELFDSDSIEPWKDVKITREIYA